jgi:hypothetical protein
MQPLPPNPLAAELSPPSSQYARKKNSLQTVGNEKLIKWNLERTRSDSNQEIAKKKDHFMPEPLIAPGKPETEGKKVITTVYALEPIKIKTRGFLQLEPYEKVSILEAKDPKGGFLLGRTKTDEGFVIKTTLIDIHSSNLYLQALDIFLSHPKLLEDIIAKISNDDNKKTTSGTTLTCQTLISLLAARKILPLVLRKLFEREVLNQSPFRDESPIPLLAMSLVNCSKKLLELRTTFINMVLDEIKGKGDSLSHEALMHVITKCTNFFIITHQNNIPEEFILALKIIDEAVKSQNAKEPMPVLGCTLLFLRFISPAIVQPVTLCNINPKKISEKDLKKLKQVAATLGLITGDAPLDDKLKPFRNSIHYFLTQLTKHKTPIITIAEPLISEAASAYSLIMDIGRKKYADDAQIQAELDELSDQLGVIQPYPITKVPQIERINQIAAILK